MKGRLDLGVSIVLILVGFYYLIAELITIVASKDSVGAYLTHTISELGVPIGADYYTMKSDFSPLFKMMNSAFIATGIFFAVSYTYAIIPRMDGLYRYICIMLATMISIGVIIVGLFHGGTTRPFHLIGTIMVFGSAGILMLLTATHMNGTAAYKIIYICLGIISLAACILFFSFLSSGINLGFPILERLVIYPVVIFEILLGFQVIRSVIYG